MVNGDAGKGDAYRKVDPKKYQSNFSKIFPPTPKKDGKSKNNKNSRKKH